MTTPMKKNAQHKKIVIKLNAIITPEFNKSTDHHFKLFYSKIELFIKGLLYKNMDFIYR